MAKSLIPFLLGLTFHLNLFACEAQVEVELSVDRSSTDIEVLAEDRANAQRFLLPVSCELYQKIQIGENLVPYQAMRGELFERSERANFQMIVVRKPASFDALIHKLEGEKK